MWRRTKGPGDLSFGVGSERKGGRNPTPARVWSAGNQLSHSREAGIESHPCSWATPGRQRVEERHPADSPAPESEAARCAHRTIRRASSSKVPIVPERGDYILNPLGARCHFWNPEWGTGQPGRGGYDRRHNAPGAVRDGFAFTEAPRRGTLSRPSRKETEPLGAFGWMSDPAEIEERRRSGTPRRRIATEKSRAATTGVSGQPQHGRQAASTCYPKEREAKSGSPRPVEDSRADPMGISDLEAVDAGSILPLHSAWLDLILRVMEPCVNPAKPVSSLVLDGKPPARINCRSSTPAVTESGNCWRPCRARLPGTAAQRYGRDTSKPCFLPAATKIFFKTSEPRGKWFGDVERRSRWSA